MTARIDSHQHFWRLSRADYRWLTPALAPLYRDFLPADIAPHLARAAVSRTILVQAADSVEETRFLLDLTDHHAFIAAVVGWVDFEDPASPDTLAALATHPRFRGVRPMIQDIADPDWMLRHQLTAVFDAVERLGLVFDALVKPRHLENLVALANARPDLPIVIDHGGKPTIGRGRASDPGFAGWAAHLAALASLPNTACKLSGLATEAAPDSTADTLRPYIDHLLECFGPDRVLWGSDWPVVNLAGGYDRWWGTTQEFLAELTPDERDAILGGATARVYRLHT